jgi:hypothetical protein
MVKEWVSVTGSTVAVKVCIQQPTKFLGDHKRMGKDSAAKAGRNHIGLDNDQIYD